jgi:ribosomal-protein-alanine N-acetyltransferase
MRWSKRVGSAASSGLVSTKCINAPHHTKVVFVTLETAFTQFPILRTQRFILRHIRPTDAGALFEIFSDHEVMQYDGHLPHQTLDDTKAFIQSLQARYEQRQAIRWGITEIGGDDTVIGTCSFHRFGPGYHCVETGYDLHRSQWGKGVMLEAMLGVLRYGFTGLMCHRIEAVIDDANTRSKKLLLKLGFSYEGNLRQRYLIGDRFEDEYYYGLLRSEWLVNPLHNEAADSSESAIPS